MLDVQFIRENAHEVQQAADAKNLNVSVSEFLSLDERRRALLREVENLRSKRNRTTQAIAAAVAHGHPMGAKERLERRPKGLEALEGAESAAGEGPQEHLYKRLHEDPQEGAAETKTVSELKDEARQVNACLVDLEAEHASIDKRVRELLLQMPNLISPDTPTGESDADNVELKRVGEIPVFPCGAKSHIELMEALDMLDIPRGVKVSGSRGYFLKNAGLRLHRAVQQLAVDLLENRGFTVMDVPLLVREEVMQGAGFFPSGREQTYELPHDNRWLVGTSEGSLVSYYADEIIDVTGGVRLAAVSNCFRREAGSAGRDVRGLYRVHQFAKVEQVVLCEADVDVSNRMFQEITQNAEDLLTMLELPYRIVSVCTGDLSQKNYKQVDIETWMPSRTSYGETHSSSILLDFQARRCNIRYRDKNGGLRYCHTLNNTAVASPRILIPLLEVHQREDGTVRIPTALQKYMNGVTELRA